MDPFSSFERVPLAPVTNQPSLVVSELRKAVRAFTQRRLSSIVGEFLVIDIISDRLTSQVSLCHSLHHDHHPVSDADKAKDKGYEIKFIMKKTKSENEVNTLTLAQGHHNVISLIGSERLDGSYLVYLEYLKNYIALTKFIYSPAGKAASVPDELTYVRIVKGMLEGLSHLHKRGILHGDIKPDNLLIDPQSLHCKYIDFGHSLVFVADSSSNMSRCSSDRSRYKCIKGGIRGTIQYAAPEILGDEEYGLKADVWSVGCVVVEMVSGRKPWGTFDNELAASYAILTSHQTPMDKVDVRALRRWSSLSRSFLRSALVRDKEVRSDVEGLMKHPWIYLPC